MLSTSFHFISFIYFHIEVKQSLQSDQEIGENWLQWSLQRLYETYIYNGTMSVWQYGWLTIIYVTIS